MAGSRRIIEYKDFSGGEWGDREAWLAEKNQFTGTNMMVYGTGELGPRPGIRNVTPSGLTGTVITTFDDNGRLGFVQGNQIKSCLLGLGGNLVTRSGTFAENPPGSWDIYQFGNTWYISTGGAVYKYNGSSITSLNGADGQWIMLHGDRLVLGKLGSSGADPATLRYSDAPASGEFTAWDAGNLIIVGDARSAINEMYEQRGTLVIIKDEGTFHLTGVPGINETLRRVLHGIPATSHIDNMERIWGINRHRSPSYYNGSQEVRYDQIGLFVSTATSEDIAGVNYLDTTEPGGQFFLLDGSSSALATNPTRALINHQGVWSKHTLGINTTAFTNGIPGAKLLAAHPAAYMMDPGLTTSDRVAFHANVRQIGIVTMVDASVTPPVFYEMFPCLDRPGFEIASGDGDSYNYERAGDNSSEQVSGNFSLREEHFVDGSEIRVRGLVVDFRKWNTGGSLTNHFDVRVDTLRPYDGMPPQSSSTLSFDEPGSSATTAGVLQRKHFSFECAQGGGFQVHFTNIRGIAIHRVQVILDTYEERF